MSANIFYKRMIVAIVLFSMVVPSCGGEPYVPPIEGDYPAELTEPLPPPLEIELPADIQVAEVLAEKVIASGDDRLPALITTLLASGIAIRGQDGELVATDLVLRRENEEPIIVPVPLQPWRGIIFEAWEIPLLAHALDEESMVSIRLTDLAATITEIIPELKGAPVADLMLKDIRATANDPEDSKQLWALFLVELGRQSRSYEPYDLLDEGLDPAKVQLNSVQVSLIMRQLATDLLNYAEAQQANLDERKPLGLLQMGVRPIFAQSSTGMLPCTLSETAQTILEINAIGQTWGLGGVAIGDYGWKGLFNYLRDKGVEGYAILQKFRAYASAALAYARAILTYLALKVEITIDKEPLIRTKKPYGPGEGRHQLTAHVKMDIGNEQLANCFRVMLNNGLGLDFKLPQDGALKNARIGWYPLSGFDQAAEALHGGSEAIVQLVADPKTRIQEGGPFTSDNPITNQATDSEGKAYIGVEGRPQKKEKPQSAAKVQKQASIAVNVAVQGNDLFKDISSILKSAPSAPRYLLQVVPELLYRAKWFTAGHFSFEVTDWTEGCQGTISYGFHQVIDATGMVEDIRSYLKNGRLRLKPGLGASQWILQMNNGPL